MNIKQMLVFDPPTAQLVADVPSIEVPIEHLLLLRQLLNPSNLLTLSVGDLVAIQNETQRVIDQAKAEQAKKAKEAAAPNTN